MEALELEEDATLCEHPQSLKELWIEFKFGLKGSKPAEQFTRQERNANRSIRQKYYRRKVFWDTMSKLIRMGDSIESAVKKIRESYGHRMSITHLLDKMLADRKKGGHPNLP